MKEIHSTEKEQFEKLFRQEHIDKFENRFIIMEVFLQIENHVTEQELIDILQKKGYLFDRDFVKETLSLICRFGFAQQRNFNGHARYEHRHLGQHHDHMICTKCGVIIEFENEEIERLQKKIAEANGFHMLLHKMELYGICGNCFKERVHDMPLVNAKQGERLKIKEVTGGTLSRMRLLSMGLRPGDEIEIITNLNKGQIVVALNYHRYAIGRGLAQKIIVESLNN